MKVWMKLGSLSALSCALVLFRQTVWNVFISFEIRHVNHPAVAFLDNRPRLACNSTGGNRVLKRRRLAPRSSLPCANCPFDRSCPFFHSLAFDQHSPVTNFQCLTRSRPLGHFRPRSDKLIWSWSVWEMETFLGKLFCTGYWFLQNCIQQIWYFRI